MYSVVLPETHNTTKLAGLNREESSQHEICLSRLLSKCRYETVSASVATFSNHSGQPRRLIAPQEFLAPWTTQRTLVPNRNVNSRDCRKPYPDGGKRKTWNGS